MLVWSPVRPRSTDSRPNDENIGPYNTELAQYEGRSNMESTNLQNYGEEGSLGCPRCSMSTPRGDVPPEQPNWSQNIPLPANSTLWPEAMTVGLQDCSGETCSPSEETKAPQRQQLAPPATRHEHSWESLPHSCRPCEQWGSPLSLQMLLRRLVILHICTYSAPTLSMVGQLACLRAMLVWDLCTWQDQENWRKQSYALGRGQMEQCTTGPPGLWLCSG